MAKKLENAGRPGNAYLESLFGGSKPAPLKSEPAEEILTDQEIMQEDITELKDSNASAEQGMNISSTSAAKTANSKRPDVQGRETKTNGKSSVKSERKVKRTNRSRRNNISEPFMARSSFTVVPEDFEKVKIIASMKKTSISEIINDLFKEYIQRNKAVLEVYEKMTEAEKNGMF